MNDDIFYHVTSFASVDSIAANGLRPRRGAGVYSHGGYKPSMDDEEAWD